ncbi:hypothetical protein BH18ACT15_BH18ACT15_03960 [soil metagenome]
MTAQFPALGREVPVYIPAGEETLFGVVTTPESAPNGTAVIILSGGDEIPSTNRNRVSVRLARRLAAQGYHALRLDYRGIGESTGEDAGYSLKRLAVEDLRAAVQWLEGVSVADVVLVGSCFGARTCLAFAGEIVELRGIALISIPVIDTRPAEVTSVPLSLFVRRMRSRKPIRGLFRFDKPAHRARSARIVATGLRLSWRSLVSRWRAEGGDRWVSGSFVDALVSIIGRGIPTLILYGSDEHDYREFCKAREGRLNDILAKGRRFVRVSVLPGEVHAFAEVELQHAVEQEIVDWARELVSLQDSSSAAVGRS